VTYLPSTSIFEYRSLGNAYQVVLLPLDVYDQLVIVDIWIYLTLHYLSSFVHFYVLFPFLGGKFNLLPEAMFLKKLDGKIISKHKYSVDLSLLENSFEAVDNL
jgi:hypothetical protein